MKKELFFAASDRKYMPLIWYDKPVQRRILHSMKRLDDGRYNKVANIVGPK